MTEDWILPQSLEVVMGHQEINQLWRQAWTDGAQREALGEENELGRIRRKERTVHIIQQTQPAASAPRWGWACHTADCCWLPAQAERLLLPGARYCHLQYNWDSAPSADLAGSSDLSLITRLQGKPHAKTHLCFS